MTNLYIPRRKFLGLLLATPLLPAVNARAEPENIFQLTHPSEEWHESYDHSKDLLDNYILRPDGCNCVFLDFPWNVPLNMLKLITEKSKESELDITKTIIELRDLERALISQYRQKGGFSFDDDSARDKKGRSLFELARKNLSNFTENEISKEKVDSLELATHIISVMRVSDVYLEIGTDNHRHASERNIVYFDKIKQARKQIN